VKTVTKPFICTTEVNRSKFIAHLVPIFEYEGMQDRLKAKHPKASHIVYALRYLNNYNQIVENSSDDGEPKGCAGVPVLNVLRGEELIECAVFVVRYFGGIKLGTGGMARAYALSVKNLLADATLVLYEKEELYTFSCSYSEVEKRLYWLKKLDILKFEREFGVDSVVWKIVASREKIEKLKNM
jgi:uncharacterized YigZ family protein